MKKTRKFISIFAILFAIVLALSVCFFAACKGNSDDEGNSGDTGTQQGDETGSGSGDGSGSGSGTDGGSGSGTDDGSESGAGQKVTQVVYLATSSDVENTTAGDAVFTNESDLKIAMSSDGLTYTVSGTASVMGEAEAAWYATDDVEEGTPYVVIKIAVAEGESIYYENSGKTYTNDKDGAADFDNGYIFIVCKLSFEDDKCVTETKYDITPVEGEVVTYTVSFSGVTYPVEEVPVVYSQSHTIDFNDEETYSNFITFTDSSSNAGEKVANDTYTSGILKYVSVGSDKSKLLSVSTSNGSVNTLTTGGATTTSSNVYYGYFAIDLTEYEGENVKIEVLTTPNTDSANSGRSMFISKALEKPTTTSANTLAYVTPANAKDGDNPTLLSYEGLIDADTSALYITWDNNLCIFSITISLTGDVDPWANEGTSDSGNDGEVEYAFYLDFTGSDYSTVLDENRAAANANVTLDETSIFTVNGADSTGSIKISIKNGGLNFGGAYSSNVNIKLDLSSFENENITIGFAAKSNDSDHVLYAYLAQDTNNTTNLATLTLQKKNEDGDSGVLTKELDVTSDNSTLYILCSNKVVMTSFWIIVNETV